MTHGRRFSFYSCILFFLVCPNTIHAQREKGSLLSHPLFLPDFHFLNSEFTAKSLCTFKYDYTKPIQRIEWNVKKYSHIIRWKYVIFAFETFEKAYTQFLFFAIVIMVFIHSFHFHSSWCAFLFLSLSLSNTNTHFFIHVRKQLKNLNVRFLYTKKKMFKSSYFIWYKKGCGYSMKCNTQFRVISVKRIHVFLNERTVFWEDIGDNW